MTRKEFKEILLLVARRCAHRRYKYQILNRDRLGEAEVRNVMAKTLDEKRLHYGIEIPTSVPHKLTGVTSRRALFDMVIYNEKASDREAIIVEFKRGQPKPSFIEKDMRKMISEPLPAVGACFVHILPEKASGEMSTEKSMERAKNQIINKYNQAYHKSKELDSKKAMSKWFILFILDVSSKKYYYYESDDINKIDAFPKIEWERIRGRG